MTETNSAVAVASCVALMMFVGSHQARADESVSAAEFAARCLASGGNLTLEQNLVIDGGVAELDECRVTAGSFRLKIEHARLSSNGFLRVFGESGGEICVEHSILTQSDKAIGPVNILLRAHR